jgi:hypothetical protein
MASIPAAAAAAAAVLEVVAVAAEERPAGLNASALNPEACAPATCAAKSRNPRCDLDNITSDSKSYRKQDSTKE